MEVKNSEGNMIKEFVTLATDIDNKTEAYKEFLQGKLQELFTSFKQEQQTRSEAHRELEERVARIDKTYEAKVGKLEGMVLPAFENVSQRRKIDYEDLKGWLLTSIDTRIEKGVAEMKDAAEERFKIAVGGYA